MELVNKVGEKISVDELLKVIVMLCRVTKKYAYLYRRAIINHPYDTQNFDPGNRKGIFTAGENKVWQRAFVKYGKYSLAKFVNFVYICLTHGKA